MSKFVASQRGQGNQMASTIVAETQAMHKIDNSQGISIQISNGPGIRNQNSSMGENTNIHESRKDNETQISFIKDPKLEDQIKSFRSQTAELEAIIQTPMEVRIQDMKMEDDTST